MLDLRDHFQTFRKANPDRIHLAAHSHHYWPDAACAAQTQAVALAARAADDKWETIFGALIPRVQRGIAGLLSLRDPATIAFAPNTHEFIVRLFSALALNRPLEVLTTDSEFHSFRRQLARMEEEHLVLLERVPTEPFETFHERFARAASHGYDLVFLSHVFFNSGATAGDLAALATALLSADTLLVIDGYHGFMALPTDLAPIADRAFYLAGGYKYAMAGEGACFMHCPPGYAPRPRDTGWFAGFGALTGGTSGEVAYAADASRFMGATFDPSGLYRLAAVFDWMQRIGLSVHQIHAHVLDLQRHFMQAVEAAKIGPLVSARLVTPVATTDRGHFLCYETPDAAAIHARLARGGIVSDVRGARIRFGFGCYHTADDIGHAVDVMAQALA